MDANASIAFANGSSLHEGNPEGNYGGNGGIELECSIGYKLKWEAGVLYVLDPDGLTVRTSLYHFSPPTTADNALRGYMEGSRWVTQDDKIYRLSNETVDDAIWVDVSSVMNFEVDTGTGINKLFIRTPIQDAGDIAVFNFRSENTDEASWGMTEIVASAEEGVLLVKGDNNYLTLRHDGSKFYSYRDNSYGGNAITLDNTGATVVIEFGYADETLDKGGLFAFGSGTGLNVNVMDSISLSAHMARSTITLGDASLSLYGQDSLTLVSYETQVNGTLFTFNGNAVVTETTVPATASSAGVAGTFAKDANYLYVCVATNTWKRTPLSTW